MIQFKKTYLCHGKFLLFVIVISLFLFISCKTIPIAKTDIVGKYSCKLSHHDGISLTLEENGRFVYDYYVSQQFLKSEGEWLFKDNKVLLNSFNASKKRYVIVEEGNVKPKHRYIQIKYFDNLSFQNCTVIVNNLEKMFADGDGFIFLDENQKIKSIGVEMFDSNNVYTYTTRNPNADAFIVTLMQEGINTIYFEDEKGRFVNGTLKILNKEFIKQ